MPCCQVRVTVHTAPMCMLAEMALAAQPRASREIATVMSCTDSTPSPPNCSGGRGEQAALLHEIEVLAT